MTNEDKKFLAGLVIGCYKGKMQYAKFLGIAKGYGYIDSTVKKYVKSFAPKYPKDTTCNLI